MTEAQPSPFTPVVETKAPEVAEAPQLKVEPEPVIEPPRFGAVYVRHPLLIHYHLHVDWESRVACYCVC